MAPQRLTIAQVTPHPLGARHEVNEFVERVSAELAGRGHRIVIATPSELAPRRPRVAASDHRGSRQTGRASSRAAIRRVLALGHAGSRCRVARDRGRRRCRSTSAARSRACSAASTSTSSTSTTRSRPASRRRRCVTRARSTSAASTSRASGPSRPRSRGRWSRSSSAVSTPGRRARATTETLIERFFPGHYELVEPGAEADVDPWWPRRSAASSAARRGRFGSPSASTRRRARCACSCARSAGSRPSPIGRRRSGPPDSHRGRGSPSGCAIAFASSAPGDCTPEALVAGADVLCRRLGRTAPGARPDPRGAGRPRRCRSCSQMPLYTELTRDGEMRPALPAGRRDHPRRPARAPAQERRAAARAARKARGAVRDWSAVADQVEEIYRRIARPPPRSARQPRGAPQAHLAPARDRRRPAHAHRPLVRLRDAGRDAARDGARARASARSRSPTTTRSPARSRRTRSPTSTGSR